VARQLTGAYKVKHPAMKRLYEEAIAALRGFDSWRIRSVPRLRTRTRTCSSTKRLTASMKAAPAHPPAKPSFVTDALTELTARLNDTVEQLRAAGSTQRRL